MARALVVFSHLRWNFVYQRPQQLLSRLSQHHRVLFIEEPVESLDESRIEVTASAPGILVCRPHLCGTAVGFHDEHIHVLQPLIERLLIDQDVREYVAWFYTPMALPLIDARAPSAVVYDCMDELSAFLNAPRQVVQREHALLKRADLVFTGGLSLYRAKRDKHADVHCFPSSVDAAHFEKAKSARLDSEVQDDVPRPRLGFFGVIDERLDLSLMTCVADAHPEWHIVLVGPVVKIDPQTLPRRPNIHYLGQQSYDSLPRFVAGWDVCLMPFAMNEATRFISPTKTLEYMAAGKPVVSTPVPDVVESHGDIVQIAGTPGAFVAACETALSETGSRRLLRQERMAARVRETSWDRIAAQMRALIETKCLVPPLSSHDSTDPTPAIGKREFDPPRPLVGRAPFFDAIIVGAGPTGLSAAYHLGKGSLLLESGGTVGGLCRSLTDGGFTFDLAGHIMFSNDPYVHQLYKRLLGENVHWQNREAWVHSKGVDTRYPFQGALYGLPADVLKECIIGAVEARFGPITDALQPPLPPEGDGKTAAISDCCADGVAGCGESLVDQEKARRVGGGTPSNFEEFIYKVWGAGVAKHFAIPYNRKLWAVPLDQMETSWLGGRVPLPNLEEMIDGALRPVPKPVGPNARFGYPLRGGFQALMDGFLPLLEGELQLNAKVVTVVPSQKQVVLADGRRYSYRQLISTAPLPKLVEMFGDEAPSRVREAAQRLRHVSVRCVNLGIARPNITDKHWIYYPEDTVFHRIFVQGNASPHCNAPGGFGLTCEISYSALKPLPCDGDGLIDLCIADCVRSKMLREDDVVIARNQIDMPFAYVIYDHSRKQCVDTIREWLAHYDVILAGRYAEWEYYNSDHAFLAGKRAAATVREYCDSRVSVDAS